MLQNAAKASEADAFLGKSLNKVTYHFSGMWGSLISHKNVNLSWSLKISNQRTRYGRGVR